jgi:hypothetical protein
MRVVKRLFFAALNLILISCGGDPTGGSVGIAPVVSLRATAFGSGTLTIEGSVDLPTVSSEGSSIRLYISRSAGTGGGSQEKIGSVTTTAHEVRYSVSGLPSGDYKIQLQVDESGNGIFSESGDYEGWYNGSTTTPIQNSATAATIVLASVSRSNMNFGIGAIP